VTPAPAVDAMVLHHLVAGPPRHGVTRYAELLLAAHAVAEGSVTRVHRPLRPADLPDLLLALPPGPLHLHVTDHLLGEGPEQALEVVRALAVGRVLGLTLHDLPQPSDGAPYRRRCVGYAGMARAADAVVVSSMHEHDLLLDLLDGDPTVPVTVVPLAVPRDAGPVGAGPAPGLAPRGRREVAVLGFVYPGKGHEEVLRAMAGLPADVALRVLGGVSPGHDHLLQRLRAIAAVDGREVRIDGWVEDAELPQLLREVDVPVFAPRHVSASASLLSWRAAGRRPVTTRNRYTEEMALLRPGTLLLVQDGPTALAHALAAALADPAATRLPVVGGTDGADEPAEAARRTFAAVGP